MGYLFIQESGVWDTVLKMGMQYSNAVAIFSSTRLELMGKIRNIGFQKTTDGSRSSVLTDVSLPRQGKAYLIMDYGYYHFLPWQKYLEMAVREKGMLCTLPSEFS